MLLETAGSPPRLSDTSGGRDLRAAARDFRPRSANRKPPILVVGALYGTLPPVDVVFPITAQMATLSSRRLGEVDLDEPSRTHHDELAQAGEQTDCRGALATPRVHLEVGIALELGGGDEETRALGRGKAQPLFGAAVGTSPPRPCDQR